jgi:hypothetical protein
LAAYWLTDTVAGRDAELDFDETQLHHWKLLEAFQQRLEPVLARRDKTPTELNPRRRLQPGGYLSMMLFALLNPVIKSTRALCAASRFQRMQAEVCAEPVSLASFSEMQAVCEPELLAGLLRELSAEALPVFGDKRVRAQVRDLIANDGTLLPALPRMAWALWQDERNRAGKLHLEFSVWRQVPSEFTVTPGNDSERAAWEAKLKPGSFYVNDRHFSHDYKLIRRVLKAKASVVLRLFNNTVLERLEPARTLSEADRRAGVLEDVRVRLGTEPDGPVGRLVRVEADGHTFLLFTDREDLAPELVALIYRYRWQIELFFKWIKCVLGCRHWLAESQAGVTLQVYCALIASVLLVLWTGSKPTKRQWEALQLYWMGWATLEELERVLHRVKKAR